MVPTFADIQAAAARIAPFAIRTPLVESAGLNALTGGRVFLFLETDDFARDHAAFVARGVRFLEAPRHEDYGTVAVFTDLYGTKWDLLQPAAPR